MAENDKENPPRRRSLPDIPGASEEYPTARAARFASRFQLPPPVEAFDFPDKGNIHRQTFLIVGRARDQRDEFLLQEINQQVFTRPRTVMASMLAVLDSQRRNRDRGLMPEGMDWEVVTLVPTRGGDPYLEASDRMSTTFWRLMVKIPGCRTYKSLGEIGDRREQLAVAEEAGRGLATYGDLTTGMDVSSLANPLPGYRDTKVYYDQLTSILAGNRTLEEAEELLPSDELVRSSTEQHFIVRLPADDFRRRVEDPVLQPFIELSLREMDFGMQLLRAMADGRIRTVAIHGDTKLENFLFSAETGAVKSLVDLDTIMPHTWLVDWGDMVRSLANVAGEKERDLSHVQVDMEIYEAVARGFLSTAREVREEEVDLMVDAVETIALELGVRFLTDYLRGDTYFRLSAADPPDLNKVRAMAQLTLFERLREQGPAARRAVESLRR